MGNEVTQIGSFIQPPKEMSSSFIELPDPYQYQVAHPLTGIRLMDRALSDDEKKEFSPDEDLFKAVVENVFLKEGYTTLIPLNELKRMYLAYRDVTDVPTLITHLEKAEQDLHKITAEQARINQESSWLNEPLPQVGSWAEAIQIQSLMEQFVANCKVDILKYLARFNARRKNINLTEDIRLAETE